MINYMYKKKMKDIASILGSSIYMYANKCSDKLIPDQEPVLQY